ncbi:MAG: TRAM domain-containing protein [archaeon]|nr:TRAM domain-containing protein [Nanoarchaeota archaeon]
MNENEAPIKAGEVHEVKILSVGEKGDGITKVNGFVVFVPDTKKGDFVKIKITKVMTKFGFAEVLEKLEKKELPQKFMEVKAEELTEEEPQFESHHEETEDFGADLEDEG